MTHGVTSSKALYGAELPLVHTQLPAVREPRLGDVVIFNSKTEPDIKVVERVVGVPGDTLEMRGGTLYRDGVRQVEPYVQRADPAGDSASHEMRYWQLRYLVDGVDRAGYRPTPDAWGPIVVPQGQFFVMGDDQDNPYDSRYWGSVDRRSVRGRPLFVYSWYDSDSWRELPFLTAIRWFSSPH